MCKHHKAFRTLHVNTEPTWRGGELQTLLLLRGLREAGIQADLVCPPGTALSLRAAKEGFCVYNLPLRGEVDIISAYRLRRVILEGRYQIVHAHTSHAHSLCALAAVGTRAKLVVSRRVDFSIYRRSFLGLNLIKYRFGYHRIIAVSNAVKKVLLRDGVPSSKIAVIHSGIDPERFSHLKEKPPLPKDLKIPPQSRLLLNTAHLTPHKGQIYLIRAIPYVLQRVPEAFLCIAGQGELRQLLESEAERLGIKDRVLLPGFRSDVEVLLANASVYVMPSVEEGLGTAVLDAMLLGIPVVATAAGGLPEMVEHERTGLLVPPADPLSLAEGIVRILQTPELGKKLAACARKRVMERFTYQRTAQETINLYEEILNKGNRE